MRHEFIVTCPGREPEVYKDITKAVTAARNCKGKWQRTSRRE